MKTVSSCRVCGEKLETILNLGELYVSNFVKPEEDPGPRVPLELTLCCGCWLVQLRHSVPMESLYRTYWYRSGTNATMRAALADIAHKAETLIHLKSSDSVLDIGCNDGTLLASYQTPEIHRFGFDPAENLAAESRKVAEKVWVDFFDAEVVLKEKGDAVPKPRVVTSIAMFYDLENPKKFVMDIKKVMHPDGLWIVQMSYLPLMLQQHEVGNICHEHLEYYSLQSFEYLLDQCDFDVVDVELNDVNGGSFRAYIRNRGAVSEGFGDSTYRKLAEGRVNDLRAKEAKMGLQDKKVYHDFAFWIERIKQDVVNFVTSEQARGKTIYLYGASTKGNTVLQYYGLGGKLIVGAADRNPDKWGRLTVGSNIKIVSEDDARAQKPDYFLVLPWHFLEEFKSRESTFLKEGGRFILPAPYFTLV